jgi:GNAT superfamily N-acetyltransferase
VSEEVSLVFEPGNEFAEKVVTSGLERHNIAATGQTAYYPVSYFLKSARGEVLGGLLGSIWAGWLHIKIVWVAEPLRGKGHARELVRAAEQYARERGCCGANLETFTFQAQPLYEKLGYEVFGEIKDFPTGHTLFFMKKMLG